VNSEERLNVNRSGSGTSSGISSGANRFGVLWGAILLLAAGCLLLGSASRSRTSTASPQVSRSPLQSAILSASSSAFAPDVATQPNSSGRDAGQARALLSQLPLLFEPNLGQMNLAQTNSSQSDSAVRFIARGSGYSLFLDSAGAMLALRAPAHAGSAAHTESVRMKLAGASPSARIAGADLLPGKSNYFIGNDRSKWRSNIPQFARVSYEEVYPGINLVFYGKQGQLEYDFQVAPGADPSQAQLEFDGAQKVELSSGSLILKSDGGSLLFAAPTVYQEIDGRRQPVEGRFALRASNRVGFEVGPYDHSRELIIDPVLTYSTYFGGSGNDTFPYVTVDILGNIYLTGSTTSSGLPTTTGAFQPNLDTPTAQNIFILKLNPQAGPTGVEYLTYLGGSGTDTAVGIGENGINGTTIYVAGTTTSTDFPTTQTAYQTVPKSGSAGPQHVFVTALNPTATNQLVYSTYLSGSGADIASGMTIDTAGNVYVTGTTTSTALGDEGSLTNQFPASATPEAQPFQPVSRGATIQFFVTKVATTAAGIGSILYSTYFGGGAPSNAIAVGGGIAVDTTGNIYFTGTTNFIYTGTSPVTDFPILNAYQPCLDTPPPLVIVVPALCNNSTDTATDAFVAKLNNPTNTQATQLAWSTYFGGANTETGTGIAVDAGAANVYITGSTNSSNFILPTTISSFAPFQLCLDTPPPNPTTCTPPANPLTNAYVARFNNISGTSTTTAPVVMSLTYFSYLGGSIPGALGAAATGDAGLAITVDPASDALITGYAQTTDFPIYPPAVIQGTLQGPQNAFFGRLNTATLVGQSAVGAYVTYFGGNDVNANGTYLGDRGTSIAIDQNLNTYFAGDTTSTNLLTLNPLQGQNNGAVDTFVVALGTAADLAITNAQLSNPTLSNQVPVGTQVSTVYTITNNGPDLATNVVVLGTIPAGTTFDSASATSGSCSSTVTTGGVACTISSMQAGSTATVTIVLTANQPGGYTSSASVSSGNNIDPVPGNNSGSISFTATAFILNVTPSAFAVQAAGDSAFYTVTVTPQPVYGANVSLSVSGLPGASKSSYSAPSVALTSPSPVSSTLTVSTTARPINIGSVRPGRRALYAAFLAFPAITFLGFGVSFGAGSGKAGKSRRRRLAGLLMLCVLFGLIWLQPACAGGTTPPPQGGTPPGTYNLVITAAGGTYSKNQTVQLVVP
jgi:uncharacterized repeat protein (TIGR01451 family)